MRKERYAKSLLIWRWIRRSSATLFFCVCSTSVNAQICSTDANVAIADGAGSNTPGAPASITITIPAAYQSPITDLNFLLRVNHTYVGDLVATLTSPANTSVTIFDRPGRPPATFGCTRNNIDVTLDDSAGTTVESQCANTTPTINGTRQPNNPLSAFNGEIPAGDWTLTVQDFAGSDLGTIISASNCIDVTTVPVVLSNFKSKSRGRTLTAEWQTASEAFNLGFDLWGKMGDDWVQLNRQLVESRVVDAVEPQSYKHRIRLNKLPQELEALGISSLSTAGEEKFYGPFLLNQEYGEQTVPDRIDWSEQRKRHSEAMLAAGYQKIKGRWRKVSAKRATRLDRLANKYTSAWLDVDEEGIYRVSFEELRAAGIDLKGLPIHSLALTRDGAAVPRFVELAGRNPATFGPGDAVVFYGQGPLGTQTRYVDSARYQLGFQPNQVLIAKTLDAEVANDSLPSHAWHAVSLGDKLEYSFALPGDDPWFDRRIRAIRANKIETLNLQVPATADLDRQSQVVMSLVGGVEFPRQDVDGDGELEPHHHFKVYLNPDQFPDAIHEGFANGFEPINLQLDSRGQLLHGENNIVFELIPDNGLNIDAVFLRTAMLRYQTRIETTSRYDLEGIYGDLSLAGVADTSASVYRSDAAGNLIKVDLDFEGGETVITLPEQDVRNSGNALWLLSNSDYKSPRAILPRVDVDAEELDVQGVTYLVLAHPSLIGEDLQRFVEFQQSLDRAVKVIDVQSVYNHYSAGLPLPNAISTYLAEQATQSDYAYVLLVGGHTYNYRAYNTTPESAPINLIPAFYRDGISVIRQTPTAVPFVDFNNDGAPERAIGRWPVRDVSQLKKVVDKTLAWHQQGSHKNSKQSLFIAGAQEAINNFSGSNERVIEQLGNELNPWADAERIYMDDLLNDEIGNNPVTQAREQIVSVLNAGVPLTVFNGHASPTSWGNQNLMTPSVAKLLTNAQAPSLMVPLACYTTYYETPNIKSLAETLFSDNAGGAVAISSASTLSRPLDNENFAKRLLHYLTVQGLDLGTSVMRVKQEIYANGEEGLALSYSWTTLGDPSLNFGLPNIEMPEQAEIDSK